MAARPCSSGHSVWALSGQPGQTLVCSLARTLISRGVRPQLGSRPSCYAGSHAFRRSITTRRLQPVMESRIANVQILRIDDEHAMAQLRTSITIARGWSRFLLDDESIAERDRVRAVLRLNERVFRKCDGDTHFRQLFAVRGGRSVRCGVSRRRSTPGRVQAHSLPADARAAAPAARACLGAAPLSQRQRSPSGGSRARRSPSERWPEKRCRARGLEHPAQAPLERSPDRRRTTGSNSDQTHLRQMMRRLAAPHRF